MQQASPPPAAWNVVCLCAAWCGVCRDWDGIFRSLAADFPDTHFAWIDVEDDDEAMGDVDIETFPTLLVAQAGTVHFFGPVAPAAAQVRQLLERLREPARQARVQPAATALLARLRPLLAARSV